LAKRVDTNQKEIVKALRKIGCSVQPLHEVGHGCPDLLIGYRGKNYTLEIKDGEKPPSKRKLTPDEQLWHYGWRGQVATVNSVDEAIAYVTR
jgi:hypothetical protein